METNLFDLKLQSLHLPVEVLGGSDKFSIRVVFDPTRAWVNGEGVATRVSLFSPARIQPLCAPWGGKKGEFRD